MMTHEEAEQIYEEIEKRFPNLNPVICPVSNGFDSGFVVDTKKLVVSSPQEIEQLAVEPPPQTSRW